VKTAKVIVEPWQPEWKTAFEAIRAEVEAALGDRILSIQHVGSTSVEGMSAKPCIDLDVVIRDYGAFDRVAAGLASIGYIHEGDLGIPGREAFRYDDKAHLMRHHLYVCPRDSRELRRHITFREYLKSHPEAVKEYSAVKEEAARRYPNDIDGYMAFKAPCIEKLYKLCGLE
jgi:GrpB-like predicted nucleotidyltransferase (UPF0157 family)